MTTRYVESPFVGRRRATRVVMVGDVGIGGDNPIRVQSMTTTDTRDTQATADQAERLADAGCEIVRITAPSITDAENLREIKAELDRRGVRVPLVADIHFTPNAALVAAEIVEKVRVNPGNYADKKKFAVREYTDAEYAEELERIAERFRPLVLRLAERGAALRIGTNHGSLSDRIMNRYGDTPLGMVESALEFLDVCEGEGYRDIVFSMKASNAQVAIQAYRLLAARLEERAPGEPSYPFHVGVTEAGDGEDGRIKSAIGIGALLEDGIGDTIRVSLTEEPAREVPVASALAVRAVARWREDAALPPVPASPFCDDPYAHARRATRVVALGRPAGAGDDLAVGGHEPARVELDLGPPASDPAAAAAQIATSLALLPELPCEGLRVHVPDAAALGRVESLSNALRELEVDARLAVELTPALVSHALAAAPAVDRFALPALAANVEELAKAMGEIARAGRGVELVLAGPVPELTAQVDFALRARELAGEPDALLSLYVPAAGRATHAARIVAAALRARAVDWPLMLRFEPREGSATAEALLDASVDLGAALCDGIGDAVSVPVSAFGSVGAAIDIAYRILQGARLRTTRTEYISCPSCGRTLFDLEETTARIKERTEHLRGVKIAVMGCIVNGPGEMADADYGYVGSGVGTVTLYAGKDVVARSIAEDVAPDRLVDIIREAGDWRDP